MRCHRRALLVFAVLAGDPFSPAAVGAQTLAGWVLDQSTGTAVAMVRVTLLDTDSVPVVFTLTDAEGYFRVTAPESGDYRVKAESAFYRRHSDGPVSLSTDDTLWVRLSLVPDPVKMDELVIEADRRHLRMVLGGYYERKEKNFGWHFDRDRIERIPDSRLSTLLRTVPGVTAFPDRFGRREPRLGGWRSLNRGVPGQNCYPRVYVDGMLFSPGGLVPSNIDQAINPQDVEGIEVFLSPFIPGRFDGGMVECGVIAVWSR